MRLGYARVSTDDQTLDRQRERLREAGCERLFEEGLSGISCTGHDEGKEGALAWHDAKRR